MEQTPKPGHSSPPNSKAYNIKTKNDKKLKVAITKIPREDKNDVNQKHGATIRDVVLEVLRKGKDFHLLDELQMESIPEAIAAARNPQEEAIIRERIGKELAASRSDFFKDPTDKKLTKDEIKLLPPASDSSLYPLIEVNKLYIVQQEKPNKAGLPWYGIFDKVGQPIFFGSTINRIKNPRSKSCPAPLVACCPCCFRKDLHYEITLYDGNNKDFCAVVLEPHRNSEMPSELDIYLFGLHMGTIKSNIQSDNQNMQNVYDIYDGHGRSMGYSVPEHIDNAPPKKGQVPSSWLTVSLYKNQNSQSTWNGMIRRNWNCTRQYELLCPKNMRPEQKLIMVILVMFLLVEDFDGYMGRSRNGR